MNSICLIVLKDYYRYIQFYKYSINMFWDTLVPNSSAVMSTDSTGVFFTATYSLFTARTDSPTASYWSDTITRHSFAQRHKSWTCPHFSCSYGKTFIWIAKRMTWRHTHTHPHMVAFSRLMTLLFQASPSSSQLARVLAVNDEWRQHSNVTEGKGAGHDQAMFLMAQLSAFPEWVFGETPRTVGGEWPRPIIIRANCARL